MKRKWIALALAMALTACGASRENPASVSIPGGVSGNDGVARSSDDSADAAESDLSGANGDHILKIGVFEPQTGDNGAGGRQEILGIQYANYIQPSLDINGEVYDVHLEIVDNQTTNGASAAETLVSRDVSVILGSYGSGASAEGGKVFAEAGIPAIGASCTNPRVTSECDVYFRICFPDSLQAAALADYAENLGAHTVYTLAMEDNIYDQDLANDFKREFESRGGAVIAQSFPAGRADFDEYILQAAEEEAGVILAPVSINYARLMIQSASKLGFQGVLLGSDTWDNYLILESARNQNLNISVSTFYRENGSDFDEGIREWLRANPDMMASNGGSDVISSITAMGYDAYFTALAAAVKAGSAEPGEILKALPTVTYQGVSGGISFDGTGDAVRDEVYIKRADTRNAEWEFVTAHRPELFSRPSPDF